VLEFSLIRVLAQLQAATTELRELKELVRSGDLDSRVLREFRDPVDYIRNTAWAVQQWVVLEQQSGDPYSVPPLLSAERVRRVTQLARDLSLDLQSVEVTYETPGLEELFESIDDLHRRLAVLFKRRNRCSKPVARKSPETCNSRTSPALSLLESSVLVTCTGMEPCPIACASAGAPTFCSSGAEGCVSGSLPEAPGCSKQQYRRS